MRRAAGLLCALALAGCGDRFDGFRVTGPGVRKEVRIVPLEPSRPDEIRFEVGTHRYEAEGRSITPKPDGAIFKIDGYLPLRPYDVAVQGDRVTVAFRLPREGLEAFTVRRAQAQLFIPTEVGVPSWSGIEHRTPGVVADSYTLEPRQSGHLTALLRGVGEALRGLYQAR